VEDVKAGALFLDKGDPSQSPEGPKRSADGGEIAVL